MTRFDHLPLYKTTMDLAVYMETVVRGFSRYHKYTLGHTSSAAEPGVGDGHHSRQFATGETLRAAESWPTLGSLSGVAANWQEGQGVFMI